MMAEAQETWQDHQAPETGEEWLNRLLIGHEKTMTVKITEKGAQASWTRGGGPKEWGHVLMAGSLHTALVFFRYMELPLAKVLLDMDGTFIRLTDGEFAFLDQEEVEKYKDCGVIEGYEEKAS